MKRNVRGSWLQQVAIAQLEKKGFLKDFDLPKDKLISLVERVLEDRNLLRCGLSQFSIKTRNLIIQTVGLGKIDTYIFSRYMNTKTALPVEMVAAEVAGFFGVPDSNSLKAKVLKMRTRAHKAKSRMLKKKIG